MNPKRIVIVSGIQIVDNPRVVKEADALSEHGYDVTVLAAILSAESLPRIEAMMETRKWRHIPVVDVSNQAFGNRAKLALSRAIARLVRLVKMRLGLEHPLQMGFPIRELYRSAFQTPADLYSLHLERALWVGKKLLDAGRPVRIDIEDWYSEDGLPADRSLRPVRLIKKCEKYLLNNAVHSTATSKAMADGLVDMYGCPRPEIVYNSFSAKDRARIDGRKRDRRFADLPSITWFSQTIGPGRGLETLIRAFANLTTPVQLHLRGTPRAGFIEELLTPLSANARSRVFFHPQVPQDELLSRLAEHDIGFCGELSDCKSRDVTITNKAFEYMRAGLAVVASDTSGQLEIASQAPKAITIFEQGSEESLATALEKLLSAPQSLTSAKQQSFDALEAHFSWSASSQVILNQIDSFFKSQSGQKLP